MRLIVPDASVILKWVLPPDREAGVDAAVGLLDRFVDGDIDLVVPSLWYYEVGNTISRLVPDVAEHCLGYLRALGMTEIHADLGVERRICSIVRQFGVTFYDAAYHATALEAGAVLVTADARYRARVGDDPAIVDLSEVVPD